MRYLFSIHPFALLLVASMPAAASMCGTVPSAEVCDDGIDNDQDGFTDCEDSDCAGGTSILINELQYHPLSSADVDGEYVELYNYGALCVSFNGWTIADGSGLPATKLPATTVVAPGETFVIAGTLDTARSCVSLTDATWTYDSTLNDSCDTVTVKDATGAVRSQVNYCNGSNGWPSCPEGTAMEYCGYTSPSNNNNGQYWKCSVEKYGCGDKGTPNTSNSSCF